MARHGRGSSAAPTRPGRAAAPGAAQGTPGRSRPPPPGRSPGTTGRNRGNVAGAPGHGPGTATPDRGHLPPGLSSPLRVSFSSSWRWVQATAQLHAGICSSREPQVLVPHRCVLGAVSFLPGPLPGGMLLPWCHTITEGCPPQPERSRREGHSRAVGFSQRLSVLGCPGACPALLLGA